LKLGTRPSQATALICRRMMSFRIEARGAFKFDYLNEIRNP